METTTTLSFIRELEFPRERVDDEAARAEQAADDVVRYAESRGFRLSRGHTLTLEQTTFLTEAPAGMMKSPAMAEAQVGRSPAAGNSGQDDTEERGPRG